MTYASYIPRTRPIPRTLTPFPFLPLREDWPLNREDVGGWNLTPFGARGRFDGRMIEVEGLVSCRSPSFVHSFLIHRFLFVFLPSFFVFVCSTM